MLTIRCGNALPLILLAATLVSCGFQLRGVEQVALPYERLIVSGPNNAHPLLPHMRDVLHSSGVETPDYNPDDYQLMLSSESVEQRALSINSRGRAGQYEVTLSVDAALYRDGQQLSDSQTFEASTGFYEDTANISGSNSGLELAREELRRELAIQIARRLQKGTL